MTRPAWVEVNLDSISANFKKIKDFVGESVKIVAVLKQFAYGHGLEPVARKLFEAGADFFGVGSLDEAIALRDDGYQGRILLLSLVPEDLASYFIRYDITPTVVGQSFAFKLNDLARAQGKVIPVHIKVDTGMGRLGFYPSQASLLIEKLVGLKFIFPEGIYTHLPSADADFNFTVNQLRVFEHLIDQLKEKNIDFRYYHCANSLGVLHYPNSYFNMVRPGLILYGIKPSQDIKIKLDPVLSFKSRIIFIKEVPQGKTVGYGSDFIAASKRKIATVAIGYADGYLWSLSNRAKVLIKGDFFDIAGRVCMDHIMVDLGEREDIQVGDTVTLIGQDQDNEIRVEDLAAWAKTIPYEIVTCIGRNLPRHYLPR